MKKHVRWISLLMIIVMAAMMVCSCKKTDTEEEAVADGYVDVKDNNDAKDDNKEETKKSVSDQKDNDTKKPVTGTEEPSDDEKQPNEDASGGDETPDEGTSGGEETPDKTPEEETPGGNETPDEGTSGGGEKLEPITKESSGTGITFLSQNIIHAGGTLGSVGDGTTNSLINRLHRFKTLVKTHEPDVIFLQEARSGTIQFCQTDPYFAQNYTLQWAWRNPDPAMAGGRQAEPVLYKTAKYEQLDAGHMWTSYTPWQPSKSYDADADYGDINSWVQLKDKQTGSVFYAYCVHYAHTGEQAQILSFKQYLALCEKLEEDEYLFAGGDYNVIYRSEKYMEMMNWDIMVDLRDVAMNMYYDGLCELGEMNGSFDGGPYNKNVMSDNPGGGLKQIDHIMFKNRPNVAVDYYGFDYTRYADLSAGVQEGWISDHLALVAKVRIDTDVDYSRYHMRHHYGENPVYFRAYELPQR